MAKFNLTNRPGHSHRELDNALVPLLDYMESVLDISKEIDPKGWVLSHRKKTCKHCNSTGKLPGETFDNLCPKCTPRHCIRCGQMDDSLVDFGTFLLCPKCEREERDQS